MPAIRYFTVRQERVVKVAAINPETAVAIGAEAFDKNSTTGVQSDGGRVTSGIIDTSIEAREDLI